MATRFLVEYNPPISKKAQKLIKQNVTESMTSNDGKSFHYHIDMVVECLQENNISKDLAIITKIAKEGVAFIEI